MPKNYHKKYLLDPLLWLLNKAGDGAAWIGQKDPINLPYALIAIAVFAAGVRATYLWGYYDSQKCIELSVWFRDLEYREERENWGIEIPRGKYNLIEPQYLIESELTELDKRPWSIDSFAPDDIIKKQRAFNVELRKRISNTSIDEPFRAIWNLSGAMTPYCMPGFRYNKYTQHPEGWDAMWKKLKY